MNGLILWNWQALVDPALSGRLCLMLLHSIWQVGLLCCLAWGVDRLRRQTSVQASYKLYVVALLASLVLLPVTFSLVEVSAPTPEKNGIIEADIVKGAVTELNSNSPTTTSRDVIEIVPLDESFAVSDSDPFLQPNQTLIEADTANESTRWLQLAPWCVGFYLVGVLTMLARVVFGIWQAQRLGAMANPIIGRSLNRSLQRLQRQWSLKAVPRIKQAEQIIVPKVVGLVRPTILFPSSALTGLSPDELEMILAHELAHICRNDVWVNLVQRLGESVLFFNPALWVLSRRISALREYCCDEMACEAVGHNESDSSLRYAQALLHVAELKRDESHTGELAALAASGRSPSELRRRIARLFGEPLREPLRLSRGGILAVAATLLLLLLPPLAQSQPNAEDGNSENTTILTFPNDRAVGVVFSRPAENSKFGYMDNWYKDWQQVAPARGKVSVPNDHHVRLDVAKSASTDLRFFNAIDPEAIQYLNLEGTDVDDKQLQYVGRLSGLLMLGLEQTKITDVGFPPLENLKKLIRLDLSAFDVHREGFGVGDQAMAVAAKLPALESITLRLTKVTDVGMAELAKNKSIRSISMAGTAVTDEGLKSLSKLPNLSVLGLGVYDEGANVTDEGMKTVGEMIQLEHLDLSGTPITNEGLKHLASLKQLKSLSFENTKVSEAGLAHLEPLQNLESIRCYSIGGLTDQGAKHLGKLTNLKRLSSNMNLSDVGVVELAKLAHLEQLSLSSKQITDVSLEHIAKMPALKKLWFQGCPITDAGLANIRNSPTIDYLLIHETKMTSAGLKNLQTIPNLKILDLDISPTDNELPDWRAIAQFKQIERFRIEGSAFSNDDMKHVKDLTQLIEFDADLKHPLEDSGVSYLSSLTNLNNLRIQNSKITDEGLKALSDMDQLEYMTLSCLATDQGLQTLSGLKSLAHLQIASPFLTDAGIDAFAKTLPSLRKANHYTYRLNGSTVTPSEKDPYWRRGTAEDRLVKDPLEDKLAPKLIAEQWLNVESEALELVDLEGKVVLVDFWGAWCRPCRDKLPILKALYQKHHANGLEIVGVHTTTHADEFAEFVKSESIAWPVAVDVDDQTKAAWQANRYPSYYLVDRAGKLRFADIFEDHLEPAIKTLLAEQVKQVDSPLLALTTQKKSTKASDEVITSLKELVKSHEQIYNNIEALSKAGGEGGGPSEKSMAAHALALARAELAKAQGNSVEAILYYEAAVQEAEKNVEFSEVRYKSGNTSLSSLLEANKQRAETKLALSKAKQDLTDESQSDSKVEPNDDPLGQFLNKAKTKQPVESQVLGDRFLVLSVTTDLQRSLLGSTTEPDETVSLCVLVHAEAFESLDQINREAPGCAVLAAELKKYAAQDKRRVRFRLFDGMSGEMKFEQRRTRMDALREFLEEMGQEAGFLSTPTSHTYGVAWDKALGRANTAPTNPDARDETVLKRDNLQVYPVRTPLSRFLLNADCIVNFLPIVRDADGVRLRADVLPAVAEAVRDIETTGEGNLLIRIRYSKTAKQELEAWNNDIPGRRAYAEKLGYKLCNVSQSQIAQSEEIVNDKTSQTITVFGRALNEARKPIAGAQIYLVDRSVSHEILGMTETNEQGEYRFEQITLPIKQADTNRGRDSGAFEIFGTAEKYALAWRPKKWLFPDLKVVGATSPSQPPREQKTTYGTEEPIELDLTFRQPSPLRGRVIDDQGEPIPNTQIAIRYCELTWDRIYHNPASSKGELDCLNERSIVPASIKLRTTDADGRFEFDRLPRNYRWKLDVRPPGNSPKKIWAVTRELDVTERNGTRIYSGDFEVVFPRPRQIKFQVVYGDTGKPAPLVGIGATVTQAGFWKTTDDNGMIEVPLADGSYDIGLMPRIATPYLRTSHPITISAESVQEPISIQLRPAAIAEITVLDADTGKPLAGVDVWQGEQMSDGRISQRVRGYRSWEVETRISHFERPRTDENGKMRVLFEPGTQRIGVGKEAFPEGYEPTEPDGKELELKAGKVTEQIFQMRRE